MVPIIEVLEMVVHDQAILNQSVRDRDKYHEIHLHRGEGLVTLSSREIRRDLEIVIRILTRQKTK
jgi:hypothetical protein